jgi:hypothetical protein
MALTIAAQVDQGVWVPPWLILSTSSSEMEADLLLAAGMPPGHFPSSSLLLPFAIVFQETLCHLVTLGFY